MTPKQPAALVFAALLVTTGAAAAAPGNAPADAGPNDSADDRANGPPEDPGESGDAGDEDDSDESAEEDPDEDDSEESAENAERGPPQDLPSQASDRALSVLDTVRTFLGGGLGPALAQ